MAKLDQPDSEKFKEALSDVVWRFHVYDQYGKNPKRAVNALAKRAPGFPSAYYQKMFNLKLNILITTIDAVNNAPKTHNSKSKYSEFSDVDMDYVVQKLREAFPDQSDDFLKSSIGMTIYWYYLR